MCLKKFTLMNILTSFILILGIWKISNLNKNMVEDDLIKFNIYSNFKNSSVELVNTGSSHGLYGLYYPLEDNKKMNLSRSSQSLYYDLQLLKKYSDKISERATIVVPISMFSFYSHYREDINQRYIPLLEKNQIQEIDSIKYFLSKNFSILYPPSNIWNTIKNRDNLKNLTYYITYPKDIENLEERKKESEDTVLSHLGISKKYYSLKNAEQDFINLINYIESKNWKLVLITTPFSYLYNQNIIKEQPQAFQERIYDNIKNVEKKLKKEFIYLDYSHDERFQNNLEYFYDDDHLNKKGAKYFTEILLKDIKKLEN